LDGALFKSSGTSNHSTRAALLVEQRGKHLTSSAASNSPRWIYIGAFSVSIADNLRVGHGSRSNPSEFQFNLLPSPSRIFPILEVAAFPKVVRDLQPDFIRVAEENGAIIRRVFLFLSTVATVVEISIPLSTNSRAPSLLPLWYSPRHGKVAALIL